MLIGIINTFLTTDTNISNKTFKGGKTLCINDLKEVFYKNPSLLTREQLEAIIHFDNLRLNTLKDISDESQYHKTYLDFQVKANLSPYQEFLKK